MRERNLGCRNNLEWLPKQGKDIEEYTNNCLPCKGTNTNSNELSITTFNINILSMEKIARRFYKTTATWQACILIQQLQNLKHFPLKAKERKNLRGDVQEKKDFARGVAFLGDITKLYLNSRMMNELASEPLLPFPSVQQTHREHTNYDIF